LKKIRTAKKIAHQLLKDWEEKIIQNELEEIEETAFPTPRQKL